MERVVDEELLGADPPWPSVNALVAEAAARYGDHELLRFPDRSLSFREVHERSDAIARLLRRRGVQPDDRVAAMLPNAPGFPLTWLAVLKLGAVMVPINHGLKEDDVRHVLADSRAALAVAAHDRVALLEGAGAADVVTFERLASDAATTPADGPLPDVEAAHLASLQFTSGTTGLPKACMLTHDYWLRLGWQAAGYGELRSDDVALTAQAYSYMDPQWNTVMALIAGVPLVVLARFSASGYWSSVRAHRASFVYVIGSMPQLLLKQPPHPADRDNRVRLVLCSGIPPELHASLEERWGAPWREAFGMTETGVDLIVRRDEDDAVGTGTVGRSTATKEARIVDGDGRPLPPGERGELCVRGRPMMLGYWNRPEETAAALRDGWLHTGDLAYTDADGRHHLVGRLTDMIRRGGENVSSAEVERVLARHPLVVDSAVVPIPDPLWGEEVQAVVQLRGGVASNRAIAEELRAFALARLARFKAPRYVAFVGELPRTPSERVAKSALRDESLKRFDLTGGRAASEMSPRAGWRPIGSC